MVRCNLSVLLAERKLNISKAAADTGISRTTLTALAYNHSRGIQYDTLNTLCRYLSVTPDKLILYYPVDFEIVSVERLGLEDPSAAKRDFDAEIKMRFMSKRGSMTCYLLANLKGHFNGPVLAQEIILDIAAPDGIEVFEEDNDTLLRILDDLPVPFKQDLESAIEEALGDLWPEHTEAELFRFRWP